MMKGTGHISVGLSVSIHVHLCSFWSKDCNQDHPRSFKAAMAAPDLNTAEGRAEAVAKLDPDFQGLLERKLVSETLQGTLSNLNVRSVSLFSVIGEETNDVRNFLVNQCQLDRANDVVAIASLVDAWNACKTRMKVRHQAEAEAQAGALPPPLNRTEAQDLRIRFEQMHYKLEDRAAPASGVLELIMEQVESGEFRPLALIQMLSRDEQDQEPLGAVIEKTGHLKVKRGHGESKPPKTGEELRQRLKLLGHCYIFMQLKFPNRQIFRNLGPNNFNKYADYLLGDHVMGLKAKNSKGETIAEPSLSLVLSYDYQVRKQMVRLMNEGTAMDEALEAAMKDSTVKERYFLTPATLEAVSDRPEYRKSRSPRRVDDERPGSSRSGPHTYGSRQGKGRGGKGRGKARDGRLNSNTPDGKPICFAWNNKDQRCRYACGRAHCCQVCFGAHPAHSCPQKGNKPPPDTSGDGGGKKA